MINTQIEDRLNSLERAGSKQTLYNAMVSKTFNRLEKLIGDVVAQNTDHLSHVEQGLCTVNQELSELKIKVAVNNVKLAIIATVGSAVGSAVISLIVSILSFVWQRSM